MECKVLSRTLLGLQGYFPVYYLAGITDSDVYNEVVLFEIDGAYYIWKELNFRHLHKSLTEVSPQGFEGIVKGYKKMNTAEPVEKDRFRSIVFDSFVGAWESIPLQIDKATRLSLKTDNKFRRTIEKMLSEQ